MGLRVYGEGLHVVLGVATTAQENVGIATVEEGSAEVVLRRAVAVAVAPVAGIATWQGIAHPQRTVVADGVGLSCGAFHVKQVLVAIVRIGGIAVGLVHGVAGVHRHGSDVRSGAVGMVDYHIVGTAHKHLGLAVAVPVVAHGVVLLVGTADHVRAEVDVPQALSLKGIAVEHVIGRIIVHRHLVGRIVTLEYELRDAVAVEVGQCDVVDVVAVGDVCAAAGVELAHGKLLILVAPSFHGGTLLLLHAAYHRGYLVGRGGVASRVGVARHLQRRAVQLRAIAVEVVLRVVVLLAEDAPADKVAAARRDGYEATVQAVSITLRSCGAK